MSMPAITIIRPALQERFFYINILWTDRLSTGTVISNQTKILPVSSGRISPLPFQVIRPETAEPSFGRYGIFFGNRRLHGQFDTATFIGFKNLDPNRLPLFQIIGNGIDSFTGNLADMQQAILARQYLNNSAEIQQFQDRAVIDFSDFNRSNSSIRRLASCPAAASTDAMVTTPSSLISI